MAINLNDITDYLLAQSWQIALIVAAIAAVNLVLRNKSAHIRYLLWLIVLTKCLIPPFYSVPLAILPQQEQIGAIPMTPSAEVLPQERQVADAQLAEPAEPRQAPTEMTPPLATEERQHSFTIHEWLAIAWIIGACAFLMFNLLRALRANLWLWRRRRSLPAELRRNVEDLFPTHGVRNFPGIWLVEGFNQPFVWGLVRGSIYLPVDFLNINRPEHQRSVLGHELSHVLRFDAAVNILQVIAQAIFWFHPLVWWSNRKIRQEREKCCDEMAVARLNTSPRDYSTAILETLTARQKPTRPVPSLAVAGPVKNIEERIKTMLRPGKKFYKHPSLIAAVVVLLIGFLTVPTALVLSARAVAKSTIHPQEEPDTLGKLEYVDHLTREDLLSVASIEVSPDGRYAYAASYNAFCLVAFKRDRETGYLEHLQTISDQNDLNGAVSIRLSPDGHYLVCTSFRSNTVSFFERDSSSGLLKKLDTFRQSEHDGQGLSWVVDAVFSPDSKFVYTISDHGQGASVSVFHITDQRRLELIQTNAGEDKCFAGARGIAISPKGDSIYVSSYQTSTVVVLDRDADSGQTKLRQIIKDEVGNVHGLEGAFAVTCSPDGKFVYCSAGRFQGDNAISVFRRQPEGTLSLVQEIFDGQEGLTGFVGGNELQVSADGQNLYALGSRSNSVVVFERTAETGRLTYLQTFYDGEVAAKDGDASSVTISPDGEYIYVAGDFDSSILIFKRLTRTKKEPSEALHRAALFGDIAQARSLIAGKVDLNKNAERGYTPLHWAIREGHKDIAELLISNGADINVKTGSGGWTVLHMAIMQQNKEMAGWLISKGADINSVNQNNELTPLLIAIMRGKTDLVEFLINKGANISARDKELNTPLHYASRDGNADMVKLLLSKGADVDAKTNFEGTSLHYATMYGHAPVAQLLIEKGADVHVKTKYGWPPLLYAARSGNKDILGLLISKGADVNAQVAPGYTALYFAVTRGNRDMAELLFAKGADVNIGKVDGQTLLQLAASRGQKEMVELLKKHGAKE